jgi:hypothetical protein
MRVLAGRVEFEPALCGQRRFPVLRIVEGCTRRLLGDGFIPGTLGCFPCQAGAGREIAAGERGLGRLQAGLGAARRRRRGRLAVGAGRTGAAAGHEENQQDCAHGAMESTGNADRHGGATIAEARRGLC